MQITVGGIPLIVNLADDTASRGQGLKDAESMDNDTGMLFRWSDLESRSFWMKDTYIPLDIAYISSDGTILNIEKMEPLSLKSVTSSGPASCALEVNRGWFEKNGVSAGDLVQGAFNNMPPLETELTVEAAQFNLPAQEFYYQDVVDPITNDIMALLPDIASETIKEYSTEYSWNYPVNVDAWVENWGDEHPFFDVEVSIVPEEFEDKHPGWNIDASAGAGLSAPGGVQIDISFRPGLLLGPDLIISLEAELANVIAHELHHLTQHGAPFERPSCTALPTTRGNSYYEYFTSACEVPAFLIGFRAHAAKTGTSINDLVKSYLQNHVSAGLVSSGEAKEISDRWLNHSVWSKSI